MCGRGDFLQRSSVPCMRSLLCSEPMLRCRYCGTSLTLAGSEKRQFCGPRCRAAAYRLDRRIEALPPCIEGLFELLRAYAPRQARGYCLIWHLGDGSTLRFPRGNRTPRRDSAGRLCWRRSFRLWPFEIPRVEFSGSYGLFFVGARQAQVPTPPPLLCGVELERINPGEL